MDAAHVKMARPNSTASHRPPSSAPLRARVELDSHAHPNHHRPTPPAPSSRSLHSSASRGTPTVRHTRSHATLRSSSSSAAPATVSTTPRIPTVHARHTVQTIGSNVSSRRTPYEGTVRIAPSLRASATAESPHGYASAPVPHHDTTPRLLPSARITSGVRTNSSAPPSRSLATHRAGAVRSSPDGPVSPQTRRSATGVRATPVA